MPLQYRRRIPRGGSRDPMYTPERDLAYIGPELIYAGLRYIEPDTDSIFRKFISDSGITESDMVEGAKTFSRMCAMVIDEKSPNEAATASGFDRVPIPVQMVILGGLGCVSLSAIWSGIKDVNTPSAEPPAAIEDLVDAAMAETLWVRNNVE